MTVSLRLPVSLMATAAMALVQLSPLAAIAEPATLYTADDRLARYSELVRCIAARQSV